VARSHRVPARARRLIVAIALLLSAGCGGSDGQGDAPDTPATPTGAIVLHPDVVDATAEQAADGTWRFDVTLSSPYDTPERYADAWRVLGPDGTVYGVRELLHDHQFEQPFTRSLSGVEIPEGVATVTVEGRDQVSRWGGETFELELP
jgi:hypothetical protein